MKSVSNHVCSLQTVLKRLKNVKLIVILKQIDLFKQQIGIGCGNETVNVHVDESRHQILTIETIHDTPVTRNNVTKVFDFECAFKTGSKEAAKRRNNRAESGQSQ
jgi:hypothetical protein